MRWQALLRKSGHRVTMVDAFRDQPCDACVALHAKRSGRSIRRFAERWPDRPLLVALTGTDLYRDIASSEIARQSLELADRLILLQPDGVRFLPGRLHGKTRVIFQSVPRPRRLPPKRKTVFEVAVVGHLRPVKDPFRAALSARRLPADSRIKIVHCGAALSSAMQHRAESEMERNARYQWLGELPRWKTLQRLGRSRLMVLSSKLEGGANVISEALACRVPVVASRISGSIGLLGADYPGYFEYGDTGGLAELLRRAEAEPAYYRTLQAACRKRQWLVDPRLEQETWETILAEFRARG